MHCNLRLIFDELGKIYIIDNFYESGIAVEIVNTQIICLLIPMDDFFFATNARIIFLFVHSWL